MKQQIQLDMHNMKTKLAAVDVDNRLRLEQELAVLSRKISDYHTDGHTAATSLGVRIQALEAQNAKVTSLTRILSVHTPHLFPVSDFLSVVAVTGVVIHPADASTSPTSRDQRHPCPQPSHL